MTGRMEYSLRKRPLPDPPILKRTQWMQGDRVQPETAVPPVFGKGTDDDHARR